MDSINQTGVCEPDSFLGCDILKGAFFLCWLSVSILAGTVGNCLIICAVCMYRKLRKVANIFIVNLAVTDQMIALFVNGFNVFGIIYGPQMYQSSSSFCDFVGFVCLVCCYSSLLTLSAIAISRYFHICNHLAYRKVFKGKNTTAMVCLLWLASGIIPIVRLTGTWGGYRFDHKTAICIWDMTESFSATLIFALSGVTTSVAICLVCYLKIFKLVRTTRAKICPTPKATLAENKKRKERRDSAKLAATLFLVFLTLFLFWTPYGILICCEFFFTIPRDLLAAALYLAHSSSSVSPWIYVLTSQDFRAGIKHVLARKIAATLTAAVEPNHH